MEAKTIDNKQVASEILNQLGGNKFIVMTGAKNWYATTNSISFKIGRNLKGVSWVLITLNGMDTYDINFNNSKGIPKSTVEGVYVDQLRETFTRHTGLDTHL